MNKIFLIIALWLISVTAYAHGVSAEDQARIVNAGYFEYMQLGATHMLSGYDHLLFLFGVVFFLTQFKDILKFITAFTIGHSITLVFATLYGVQANYYLIDAVIALTVCYKAFDNLDGFKKYLQMSSPNLLAMIFIFGLIHGFGLSTRLQQLPLGDNGLVLKILSFNVGVEVGQIVALSLMVLVLSVWRKRESFAQFSKAANVALIFAGALLLLMQLHGYQHTQHPNEFSANQDNHHDTPELSHDNTHNGNYLGNDEKQDHGSVHAHDEDDHPDIDVETPPKPIIQKKSDHDHSTEIKVEESRPVTTEQPTKHSHNGGDSHTH